MLKFDSEYSKCLIKNDKIMGLCHIKRKKNPASEPVMVNIRVFHSLPFFQLFYIQVFFQLLKYKEKVGEKVGTIQKKKAQKLRVGPQFFSQLIFLQLHIQPFLHKLIQTNTACCNHV